MRAPTPEGRSRSERVGPCDRRGRLGADGTARVLLIEAGTGTPETRREVQVPILFPRLFGSDLDWNFATVPQRGPPAW